MNNNSKPLKVNAIPFKMGEYAMCLTFCDGTQCSSIYKPSAGNKWIPAPYAARSANYPKVKKSQNSFAFWETETTKKDFINNPPAFTYVEHKGNTKLLTPKFRSDFATIKYLMKELILTDIRIASGTAFFTHTKGSFSFAVIDDCESKNDGSLTFSEVRELNKIARL